MKHDIIIWKRYKIAEIVLLTVFFIFAVISIVGFCMLGIYNVRNTTTEKISVVLAIFSVISAFLGGIFYELKRKKMNEIIKNGRPISLSHKSDLDCFPNTDTGYGVHYILLNRTSSKYEIAIVKKNEDKIQIESIPKNQL